MAPLRERRADAGSGASPLDLTRRTQQSLWRAAAQGHAERVRDALAAGARPNALDEEGRTALLLAVSQGDSGSALAETVKLLLAAGADPRIEGRDGLTPLEHAQRRGLDDIARLLESVTR